jgi:hypothetical protein
MSPSAARLWAFLRRWGEVAVTAAAALWGLWTFADHAAASVFWAAVGLGAMVLALLNLRGAIARARLATGGHGPGIVLFDEAQIGYLGPETGGVTALDLIDRVAIGPVGTLTLYHRGGAPIAIPLSAEGADGLVDALSALPGFDPAALARARARRGAREATVWRRGGGERLPALSRPGSR